MLGTHLLSRSRPLAPGPGPAPHLDDLASEAHALIGVLRGVAAQPADVAHQEALDGDDGERRRDARQR